MKVTFCGHSEIISYERTKIKTGLTEILEKLINAGATEFLLGGYGDFDLLCAMAVRDMKEKYPCIKSVLVIPYINKDYNKKLYDCSEYPFIENVLPRFAIPKRNEYMVEKSDVVIAYVKHSWGGAYKTYQYAQKKKNGL